MDRRTTKKRLGRAGVAVSLAAFTALGAAAGASATGGGSGGDDGHDGGQKVRICHATHSGDDRSDNQLGTQYRLITVSVNSIVRRHGHHTHPLDVIPAFDYKADDSTKHYPGLNWANGVPPAAVDAGCVGVSVEKTGDATSTLPGGAIHYTIRVTNTGWLPVSVNSVKVLDQQADPGSLMPPADMDVIPPKGWGDWTATRTAPADGSVCGTFDNTAQVGFKFTGIQLPSGVVLPPPVGSDTSTWHATVVCPVQVSIAKTTGQATVEPDGTVSYGIGVTNTGTLAIPAEALITVDDEGATLGSPDSTGALLPGQTRTWSATKQAGSGVAACGTFVNNTASVTLSGLPEGYVDSGAGDRSSNAPAVLVTGGICTPVTPPPVTPTIQPDVGPPVAFRPAAGVLSLVKSAPKASLAGGAVTFTLTVTNTGAGELTGVVIRDKPPATMLLRRSPVNATVANGRVLWNIGTLGAGESATREVPVTLLRTVRGRTCNTATAVADGTDVVRARACTTVAVGRRPATPVTG